MGYIPLEIIVKSAEVFKNVNFFSRMHLYTTVCLLGDSSTPKKKRTSVDEHSGAHPFWWFPFTFQIDESKLLQNKLMLLFQVGCKRNLGDKNIGILTVPIKDLYDSTGNQKHPSNVAYSINSSSSEKPRGVLYLSYMFHGKNETKCIDQSQSYSVQSSVNHALPLAPVACPRPIPSAPYIVTEDDEYVFSPTSIESGSNLPVDEYSFRSTIPSAPYLPVDYGCS